MSQVNILDKSANRIPLMHYTVSLSDNPDEPYIDDYFTDYDGASTWPRLGMPLDKPLFLHVNYFNKQVKYEYKRVEVAAGFVHDVIIILQDAIQTVEDLHADSDRIRTESGKEWKMCFGSNFLLPQLVAEGIDIVPFLYSGLNGYRMFGTSSNPSTQAGFKPFHPDNYSNWLESIGKTFDILADNGKYGQLDLICDNNIFNKDVNFLRDLQNQVAEMLRSKKNKLYSLGNENFKNGFNANDFSEPGGLITACGSGGSGDPAPLSNGRAWQTQRQHLRRDIKMFIDIPPIDAPTYNLAHIIIFDETIGYADFNQDGSRTNNKDWAYKMGRIMSAFNGGVIHLHSGGHSLQLGSREAECKDEFVRAFGGN